MGTFAGDIGHGLLRPLWWKDRFRVRPLRGSPKVPSDLSSCPLMFGWTRRLRLMFKRPRPLGTGPWCSPFDLHLRRLKFPTYGFLATGSPRLTAFLAPLSPAKLPVSYPFFLSSPCTNFDPTDFCHLRRRSNLLICLFAIFGLNDNVILFRFNSVSSNCGLWYVTVGRSARALLRKKIAP